MKRGELANRIWRTVVFSGAMLGGVAVADPKPQPAKPVTRAETAATIAADLRAVDVVLAEAVDAVVKAKSESDRKAATARVTELRKQRVALEDKLKVHTSGGGTGKSADEAKRERQLHDLDVQIAVAVDAVVGAQNQAERDKAKATLTKLRADKAQLEAAANPVARITLQLTEQDARITVAVDAVAAAQSQADRDAANAKLKALRAERQALQAQLAAEKAKAARPRTPEGERPVGRGFVLA